jgi:hypothetical protein
LEIQFFFILRHGPNQKQNLVSDETLFIAKKDGGNPPTNYRPFFKID